MIEFRVLGSFEVVEDDHPIPIGRPKQRALLAALLVHRRQPLSSDRLIDELWGERPPPTARKIVQGYVSNLRKVLGDGLLVSRGQGYMLQVDPDQTDVDRFESLVAEGHRALVDGDPRSAAEALRDALGLWRGPPLTDFAYEPFAQAEIGRLEEARLAAVEDQIEAELALGEHPVLVGELEGLVHAHPLRERFIGQLMLALYRSGRQADALDTYRRARARLIEQLGLEPGRELQELERAILDQDPTLDPPVGRRRSDAGQGVRGRKRGAILIAGGGALLLAAVISLAVTLTGSSGTSVRVAPNSVAEIDVHSNRVLGAAAVGARPGAIAFGSGSLWVANVDDETVSRVDPRTLQTLPAIGVGAPPTGIAAAGEGVWVASSGPTANFVSVRHVDPQFDVIDRSRRVDDVVPGSPAAIAGQGPNLWVAPNSGELTALDTATGRITQQFDPNSAPEGIAVGHGAVWLTDNEADNVVRVDASGVARALPVGHSPTGIAVGAGAVWVADTGDDSVSRIAPDTGVVTATIRVGHAPTGIAVGDGSVWVANSGDGTVTRIDPRSAKTIATITVGGSPQQITIAAGRAWVTVDAQTIPRPSAVAGAGTVRVLTNYDFGPLDPANGSFPQLWYAACVNLLNYPDKPGAEGSRLVPEVAQALPVRSADGKSYTFTIRHDFRFWPSNEPVTAQTFKYSIERSLNPRLKSPIAADFADIVGAPAYIAGKASDISGVVARGNTLTIRLTAPAPDLLARVAIPAFCAVPMDTPADPRGLQELPSAGPYRLASYTPGQGAVLVRNPTYRGKRPHRAARIVISIVPSVRAAIAQVEAGTADYADVIGFDRAQVVALTDRYGPGSPAAKRGHQQVFANSFPQLDFFALNTHRALFADPRLRQAVSYAIDRAALARLGDYFLPAPEQPTDHYLPPGMPGYQNVHIYPLTPDVAKAKQLANGHRGATAVLYTCDIAPCPDQAQIVKSDLAAIELNVEIKALPGASSGSYFSKLGKPGEPFDMAWEGWIPDYLDPNAMLGVLLEQGSVLPTFVDPTWRARLAAASRLAGPKRYLNYARLDAQLARDAAPFVAFGSLPSLDFFSARMGCQVFTPTYGMDLGALCIRHDHAR